MGVGTLRPAVFLDRDGVLNRALVREGKPYAPTMVDELEIVEDAAAALRRLQEAGFVLVCVTNQPEVARGTLPVATLEAIHERLRAALPLDAVYVCPHDNGDHCECRKPRPGMILRAAGEMGLDLDRSFLVGDRWRDVEAAHNAGLPAVLIEYGYAEEGPRRAPEYRVKTLREAADRILENVRR